MKILFNNPMPFMLAHGGAQIQIEQTQTALGRIGVTVEPLRWWDESQAGDVLHEFGRISVGRLRAAHKKGMKVVFSDFMTEAGSRPAWRLRLQRAGQVVLRAALPRSTVDGLQWDSYRQADACLALTEWEAHLMKYLFRSPPEKVRVVPNGVEEAFLNSAPRKRGPWLVCTATITERKRALELAEAAVSARTQLWVIGEPYSESDPYGRRFADFARRHPEIIRYEGAIRDRTRLAQIYREARGFVLLSTMESLSLSALEAAACECPLLLSRQPWATWTFKDKAAYCPVPGSVARTVRALRSFYDRAPELPVAARPLSWLQVAQQIKEIYEALLNAPG
jgi:glycosyltransferase involved in cell wall biosynthesis